MLKVKKINYQTLRRDEFLGLHQQFVEHTKKITNEEILPLVESYCKSVENYSSCVEVSYQQSFDSKVSELDKERKTIYRSCRHFVRGLCFSLDEESSEMGNVLWQILTNFPNPTRLNQVQSSGVYTKLIETFKSLDRSRLDKCGFTPWIEKLELKQDEFYKMGVVRDEQNSQKVLNKTGICRNECLECWQNLLNSCVGCFLIRGDEECKRFVESINSTIENKKTQKKISEGLLKSDKQNDEIKEVKSDVV